MERLERSDELVGATGHIILALVHADTGMSQRAHGVCRLGHRLAVHRDFAGLDEFLRLGTRPYHSGLHQKQIQTVGHVDDIVAYGLKVDLIAADLFAHSVNSGRATEVMSVSLSCSCQARQIAARSALMDAGSPTRIALSTLS